MKRILTTIALLCVICRFGIAQNDDLYKYSKSASTNVPGVEFPKVDSKLRAIFRVDAPDAQKVQVDILSVYDMVKGENGVWTVTTNPLPPGFHYYYLIVDGYRFADPASESFFGVGRMMSGIEIPSTDQDFYTPKNVPHRQIRECYNI